MILKTSDIDGPLYGTVINFIFLVFDDINNTLELSLKINKIWEQEYSSTFSTFKDLNFLSIEDLLYSFLFPDTL